MSDREALIRQELTSELSLAEYHQRRRVEAELAALEQQRLLEAERSARRWAVANAVVETIADHPVATIAVGLAGLWLLSSLLNSRRSR